MTVVSIVLVCVVLPLAMMVIGTVQRDRLGVLSRRDAIRETFLRLYGDRPAAETKLQKRALRRSIESLTSLPDGRVLVPALIVVEMAPRDYATVSNRFVFGAAVGDALGATAQRRGWRVPVHPVVRVVADERRTPGWPYARSRHVADTEGVDGVVETGNATRRGLPVRRATLGGSDAGPVPGAQLQAVSGDVADVLLLDDRPILFGRMGATISIKDESISRDHCELSAGSQGWTVRDLGSANGTFLNGTRVHGTELLRPLDVLSLGPDVEYVYYVPDPVGYRPRGTA